MDTDRGEAQASNSDASEGDTRRKHTGPRTACTHHCCGECDGCFSSLGAFESHRRGKPGARYCDVDVTDDQDRPLLVPKTERGTCNLSVPPRVGVTVWAVRDWWKAAQSFRGAA